MGRVGLLDLPPELRNRIFALSMGANRDLNEAKARVLNQTAERRMGLTEMRKPTDQHLHYAVKLRKVVFLGSGVTLYYNKWGTRESEKPARFLSLLAINHQIREEVAPVVFHHREINVKCHVSELQLVAAWLCEQIILAGEGPFDNDLQLHVKGVTWDELDSVWPFVSLAHSKRIEFKEPSKLWRFPDGGTRLQHVFAEAVKYGQKAGNEFKSEWAMEEGYENLLAAAKRSRGKTARIFYQNIWVPR